MTRLEVDFRFIEIEHELWALGEFLSVIEPQIAYLRDQDRTRTHSELREKGYDWEDPETQTALQELDERAANVFPRFFRAPFIVSLWAFYESAIIQIAEERRMALGKTLRIREIRGENFVDSAKRYFDAVLGLPLDQNPARIQFLSDLLAIRNVLAHANGQRQAISEQRLNAFNKLLTRHPTITIDEDYVSVEHSFLKQAYNTVSDSVQALILLIRGPAVRETDGV